MADISVLARFINGRTRNVNLSTNALVVGSLKTASYELTDAILGKLIQMQTVADADGSYDSRYYTESEIGDSSASSGSDLVGDDNTYSNFNPAAATVKGALSGIDSALAGAGTDEQVKVSANDTTAKYLEDAIVASQGSNSTNILEISTLNDGGDEDLQIQIDQSKIDHGSLAGLADDDHTQYILVDGTRAFSGDQSMGGNKITSLGAGTASGDAVNKGQLDAVSSLIQNFEWQASALDYITDNTAAPPSENGGDRYILSHDGGAPNAGWDGASAGDIVEFDSGVGTWSAVTPTLGTFISADDESNVLYYWGGSSWSTKAFESTTASTGLTKVGFDIQLDSSAAGAGLGFAAGVLSVNVDDVGIEISTDTLQLKDGGVATDKIADDAVTAAKINSDVAGDGLVQGAGGELDVNVDDATIEVATDVVQVKDGGISDAKVASGSNLEEAVTFFGNTDLSGAEAETLSDGSSADSLHRHEQSRSVKVAGEAFGADLTFAVRFALTGETAGRLYKADNDVSSSDVDQVIGFARSVAGVSAGGNIDLFYSGTLTLGSNDTNFNAADIGKRVYLDSAGAFTVTAPSGDDVSVKPIGIVEDVDKIMVMILEGYIDAA